MSSASQRIVSHLEWLLLIQVIMHQGARRRAQKAESRRWWRKAPRTLHDAEWLLYLSSFPGFLKILRFSAFLCHWHVILVFHASLTGLRQEKRASTKDKKSSKAKGSKASKDSKESGSLGSKDLESEACHCRVRQHKSKKEQSSQGTDARRQIGRVQRLD